MGKGKKTAPGPLVEVDPELERTLAKVQEKRRGPLLLMWIGLVVLFTVFYQVGVSVGAVFFLALGIAAVIGLGVAGNDLLLIRGARRLMPEVEVGRIDDVVAWHERNLSRTRGGVPRLMFAHDLGYYELRRGNLDRALVIHSTTFRAIQKNALVDKRIVALNRDNLAVNYAARGDLESARAWLVDPSAKHVIQPAAAALVYARAGEWDRVLALEWPELKPQLEKAMRHGKRIYSAMRALAKSSTGQTDIADDLEVGRLAYVGELDYLASDWPELRNIIEQLPPPMPTGDAEGIPQSRLLRG